MHPAQQSIRRRRSGLRSKNLFALPPPSPPPSLPFTRYCFTILYYIARYVEFCLFGFNERLAGGSRELSRTLCCVLSLLSRCNRIAAYASLSRHDVFQRTPPSWSVVTHRSVQRYPPSTSFSPSVPRRNSRILALNSDYIRDNIERSYISHNGTHRSASSPPASPFTTLRDLSFHGFFTTSSFRSIVVF